MHKLLFLKGKKRTHVYKEYIHVDWDPSPIFHKPFYCLPDRYYVTMFGMRARISARKVDGVPSMYPQREREFYTKLEEVDLPWLKEAKITDIFILYTKPKHKRNGYCLQFEFGHNIVGYQHFGGGIEIIIDADLEALGYEKEVLTDEFSFRYRI